MWLTGTIFFMFTFLENYLWLIPYFRSHVITDMTVQWKVNGSLVGSWNQLLYGTSFYLMDRIEKKSNVGQSKLAFTMFFLGLFNLMFNWSHHIYTLPTEHYIRYIGYAVSMTEWIFFIRIIAMWKKSVDEIPKNYSYYSYRFLLASEIWVFLNLGQAILMSIPAINIFTHGTHITVAHSMGTTIGINSMILFAACFEFFQIRNYESQTKAKYFNEIFWTIQISLFAFWASLLGSGIIRGQWQMSQNQIPFAEMISSLHPFFIAFFVSGIVLSIAIAAMVFKILARLFLHTKK
jgi:nitric oxide reductase subunit B